MPFQHNGFSRRALLRGVAALAGASAIPISGWRRARAAAPDLPANFGQGRSVAIVGAGVSGLTAGWKLARAGYRVTIYEGADRYGGRSLTPRPSDENYKKWWFSKYNPDHLFEKMYVSEYGEDSRNPNAVKQVCTFKDDVWDQTHEGAPVELFFNAGPGRIPSDSVALIALCRETGVALEPYIFQSNYNLMQNDSFAGGEPFVYNRVNYSLRGAVAQMLADLVRGDHVIEGLAPGRKKQMLEMLQVFGDLNKDGRFQGSSRIGYSHLPGGWRDAPVLKAPMSLGEILNSGFVGGGNPETSPGSFLFNADNIDWQNSLMQPVGGMDRVWQRLLVQEIPFEAVRMKPNGDPREGDLKQRKSRLVGDLVLLNHKVTSMNDVDGENQVRIDYEFTNARGGVETGVDVVDYCVSTMQPQLLAEVNGKLPPSFKFSLMQVKQTPAIKVGWQTLYRFWEQENNIYGGISWTTDPIGQIWYPSEDFNARTAVITGAYNRGPTAEAFGRLDQGGRIAAALRGGEKLHHGFADKVYRDRGLTIAWQYMPFQLGGWASDTAYEQPDIYAQITNPPPSRIYLAGDTWSYLPGWQEGAITAAYAAIDRMSRAN